MGTKQNTIQEMHTEELEPRWNKSLALTFLQRYVPQMKQQIPSLLAGENNSKNKMFLYHFCMWTPININ